MEGYAILFARKARTHKGGLPSIFGGANPPDERKEGDADERYILGSDPVINIHCRSCQSVLSDFQGKEIAAHYCQ